MSTLLSSLVLLTAIGAGVISGVFLAFSNFVMKALSQLPARESVAAMQRINIAVLNPLFLAMFVGTAVLGLACIATALFAWAGERSCLLAGAGLAYVIGTFGVTMVFNVRRNDRLAKLSADSAEAAAYWPRYVAEWVLWNHVRTIAAVLAAVLSVFALVR
jgi:uncharacterized membrane protein